jgi:AraC-like DNA-binding protein
VQQRLRLPAKLDGNVWRYANQASANRPHRHAELELNLVTAGSGTYLLGNRKYEIKRGDLLWLLPEQEHVLFDQTADFAMWIAVFRSRVVKRVNVAASGVTTKDEPCRRLKQHDLRRCEELLDELTCLPAALNTGLPYVLLHARICFARAGEVPVSKLHPAVERAANLLTEDSDASEASLQDLARRAGLSASRLSRLFKSQTGASIVEFRNRQRIARFQEIFESGKEHNLLNAALEAGFGSYPQFHRVLRHVLGCSPREYASRVV